MLRLEGLRDSGLNLSVIGGRGCRGQLEGLKGFRGRSCQVWGEGSIGDDWRASGDTGAEFIGCQGQLLAQISNQKQLETPFGST